MVKNETTKVKDKLTTVSVSQETWKKLNKLRSKSNETLNEVIIRLTKLKEDKHNGRTKEYE